MKEETLALAETAMAMDPDHWWSISALAAYYYRIEKDYDRGRETGTKPWKSSSELRASPEKPGCDLRPVLHCLGPVLPGYSILGDAELAVEQIEYLFTIPSPIAQVDLEGSGWRFSLPGDYVETLPFMHAPCMVHAWLPKLSP